MYNDCMQMKAAAHCGFGDCALFREVGTIIRSLECYPSEAELQDMLQEVEEEEPTGTSLCK